MSQLPDKQDYIVILDSPISMGRQWKKVFENYGLDPERVYFEELSW
ncbi:hypothetical protein [Streptococcus uberis]|nr:hypothetical protein [Streptococcus uberis]MCK1199658.1 hypothetical protein [Streptococcus uberis]MEE3697535.1 hypothetical protein [Streptococcus uberis]